MTPTHSQIPNTENLIGRLRAVPKNAWQSYALYGKLYFTPVHSYSKIGGGLSHASVAFSVDNSRDFHFDS